MQLPFKVSDYDHDGFSGWHVVTKSGQSFKHYELSISGAWLFMFSEGGKRHEFVRTSEIESISATFKD